MSELVERIQRFLNEARTVPPGPGGKLSPPSSSPDSPEYIQVNMLETIFRDAGITMSVAARPEPEGRDFYMVPEFPNRILGQFDDLEHLRDSLTPHSLVQDTRIDEVGDKRALHLILDSGEIDRRRGKGTYGEMGENHVIFIEKDGKMRFKTISPGGW